MASLLAAAQPVAALILPSYPLHRPGHPEELRTAHWPRIECPVLLLSGGRDPFAPSLCSVGRWASCARPSW